MTRNLLGKLPRSMGTLTVLLAELRLARLKSAQKDAFASLESDFLRLCAILLDLDVSEFITPVWSGLYGQSRAMLLPKPTFSFLRSRHILHTMFVNAGGEWASRELEFLEGALSIEELKVLLQEDYVGRPCMINHRYLTSHNSIHHLYHLTRFQSETGIVLANVDAIVEWGGGYGNMAKIARRMNGHATYTIIDLPVFTCVQWLYLSTVLGVDQVNVHTSASDEIKPGIINLIPVCFLKEKETVPAQTDVFIATWSLSESSISAQDYVDSVDFFDAEHLLLAFRDSDEDFPDSSRLLDIAARHGARIEPIAFLPGNYYAFS